MLAAGCSGGFAGHAGGGHMGGGHSFSGMHSGGMRSGAGFSSGHTHSFNHGSSHGPFLHNGFHHHQFHNSGFRNNCFGSGCWAGVWGGGWYPWWGSYWGSYYSPVWSTWEDEDRRFDEDYYRQYEIAHEWNRQNLEEQRMLRQEEADGRRRCVCSAFFWTTIRAEQCQPASGSRPRDGARVSRSA